MRNLFIISLFLSVTLITCKKSTPPEPSKTLYTITSTATANGTISPIGSIEVTQGSDNVYTITPSTGYYISSITVDGSSVPVTAYTTAYTFTNVQGNHTISVTFSKSLTITATAGANGTITPASVFVSPGNSTSFSFTANAGFHSDTLWIDGVFAQVLNSALSYTLSNIQANHSLKVSFTNALTKLQLDSLSNLLIGQWTMVQLNGKLGDLQDTFLPWDVQPFSACSLNQFDQFYANGIFQRNNNPLACDPLAVPGQQQFVPLQLSHWKLKNTGKVIYLTDPPLDSLTNITLTKDSLIVFFYGGFDADKGISYRYHYARKP